MALSYGTAQVVGGADHGGVLVRSGFELTSELAETRLSTGAVVKAAHGLNMSQHVSTCYV